MLFCNTCITLTPAVLTTRALPPPCSHDSCCSSDLVPNQAYLPWEPKLLQTKASNHNCQLVADLKFREATPDINGQKSSSGAKYGSRYFSNLEIVSFLILENICTQKIIVIALQK